MEKARLPPELQSMVDQFTKFRNEYLTLKTHNAAQEELNKLQKMELEKMNSHVEQLASALTDYQKRFNSTLHHFESENSRLRKVIESIKREHEDSRDNDRELIRTVQRDNEEYIRKLEDDLEALRAELASQDENHRNQIKSIEERHNNEILLHEEELERRNLLEKRHRDEIGAYKKRLEHFDSMEKRCRLVLIEHKENSADDSIPMKINPEYSHPALNNNTENSVIKRKKSAPSSYRWPQLDISVKKEKEAVQKKKRKLYLADDETVIDLTS